MVEILSIDFMQRALIAAFLVGAVAPMVGIFVVQRRMSLIGDGMGHVALAGVAVGLVTSQSPVLTALVAAVIAAIAIELLRARGRTSGDMALAIIFYGGIAAGVVVISKAPDGTPANLVRYLFGSILTTQRSDLYVFATLAAVILVTVWVLRPRLFAVANDEEYARAVGLPVLPLNLVLALLTATTVVVSMRVVGLLLISALMIVPNATAQLFVGSFGSGLRWAMAIGLACSVGGVLVSYPLNTPSGGTIVLVAIGIFILTSLGTSVAARIRRGGNRLAGSHEAGVGSGVGSGVTPRVEPDPHARASARPRPAGSTGSSSPSSTRGVAP